MRHARNFQSPTAGALLKVTDSETEAATETTFYINLIHILRKRPTLNKKYVLCYKKKVLQKKQEVCTTM